jgi:hypothetical protein
VGGVTPLSSLFRGVLKSTIKAGAGATPSITKQPFTVLQLNILPDNVHSVDDALHHLTEVEMVGECLVH